MLHQFFPLSQYTEGLALIGMLRLTQSGINLISLFCRGTEFEGKRLFSPVLC